VWLDNVDVELLISQLNSDLYSRYPERAHGGRDELGTSAAIRQSSISRTGEFIMRTRSPGAVAG
jgi:hypothetical protein